MSIPVTKPLTTAAMLLLISLSRCLSAADPVSETAGHEKLQIQGWTIHLSRELRRQDPELLSAVLPLLDQQLQRVVQAVPETAVRYLQTVVIWINPAYPGVAQRAEYHPSATWLQNNGRDPKMAKAIEITNTKIFAAENRRMPFLMLHELAHAWHDQVLGFEEPRVQAAFAAARDSGTYEAVQRFTGLKTVKDKAYALSNHKEYFAETSEAFFGRNDFFPFVKEELQVHDPEMFALLHVLWHASPPGQHREAP